MTIDAAVLEWLLEGDPAIRWQVLRDLADAPPDEVAAERARVATEGWGAELLALQDADGRWDGGTYRPGWVDESKPFFDAWTATHFVLSLLRELGVDPADPAIERAVALVRDNVRWEANRAPYFDGEVEPCINGPALANGAYFGEAVDGIAERLLSDQLDDGGWNCWAEYGATVSSFHSTICALTGLLEWEQAGGSSEAVTTARQRGEAYLLDRRLYRRRSTGDVIDPRFTMFSSPTHWYYDILWGLDYFRSAGAEPDERLADAINLVAAKRDPLADGRSRTRTKDRCPSRWRAQTASRADGTRCAPCGSSAGPSGTTPFVDRHHGCCIMRCIWQARARRST